MKEKLDLDEYIELRKKIFIEDFCHPETTMDEKFAMCEDHALDMYSATEYYSVEILDWLAFKKHTDSEIAELIAEKINWERLVEIEQNAID